jgi:alpha-L-rhamnosidase
MVLAHVMSDEDNKKIMQSTIRNLFPVRNIATPYMYHHIVEALFEAGLKEEAVKLMKEYWGKMISLGADTYWEAFDPEKPGYSPYGSPIVNSYCHAWSCTPVYLIRKYLR